MLTAKSLEMMAVLRTARQRSLVQCAWQEPLLTVRDRLGKQAGVESTLQSSPQPHHLPTALHSFRHQLCPICSSRL